MANNSGITSRNYGNDKRLSGALADVFRAYFINNLDKFLPARVISFDKVANTVSVQPLIDPTDAQSNALPMQPLTDIPVINLGSGSFSLRFNLARGNLGYILAMDRDISDFKQSKMQGPPPTRRLHNFTDSVFLPDSMVSGDFQAEAVLSNIDGTVKIEWFNDRIDLTAPTINALGDVNLGSGGNFIARLGDSVRVTVPANTFLVQAQAGVPNPAPVDLDGEITEASDNHTAS